MLLCGCVCEVVVRGVNRILLSGCQLIALAAESCVSARSLNLRTCQAAKLEIKEREQLKVKASFRILISSYQLNTMTSTINKTDIMTKESRVDLYCYQLKYCEYSHKSKQILYQISRPISSENVCHRCITVVFEAEVTITHKNTPYRKTSAFSRVYI